MRSDSVDGGSDATSPPLPTDVDAMDARLSPDDVRDAAAMNDMDSPAQTDAFSEVTHVSSPDSRTHVDTNETPDMSPLVFDCDAGACIEPCDSDDASSCDSNRASFLAYDRDNGTGTIAKIDAAGTVSLPKKGQFSLQGAWSHVLMARRGVAFFYDKVSGLAATIRLDGGQPARQEINGLGASWTLVAAAGTGSLLFYDGRSEAGGAWMTGRMRESGAFEEVGRGTGFDPWTHIVGTPNNKLVFYNTFTGEYVTAGLSEQGVFSQVRRPGPIYLSRGWTHLVAGAGDSVLFYDNTTRSGTFGVIDAMGLYQSKGGEGTWGLWSQIAGARNGMILFYVGGKDIPGWGSTVLLDATGVAMARMDIAGLPKGWSALAAY